MTAVRAGRMRKDADPKPQHEYGKEILAGDTGDNDIQKWCCRIRRVGVLLEGAQGGEEIAEGPIVEVELPSWSGIRDATHRRSNCTERRRRRHARLDNCAVNRG